MKHQTPLIFWIGYFTTMAPITSQESGTLEARDKDLVAYTQSSVDPLILLLLIAFRVFR